MRPGEVRFVAWTRSESFAMTAFKHLPPWDDFVKWSSSEMLKQRQEFVRQLEKLHEKTMKRFTTMTTPQLEREAVAEWREQQARLPKRLKPNGPLMPCRSCQEALGRVSSVVERQCRIVDVRVA